DRPGPVGRPPVAVRHVPDQHQHGVEDRGHGQAMTEPEADRSVRACPFPRIQGMLFGGFVMQARRTRSRRQGAIAPLTAILLAVLLGMVAFGVDLNYVAQAQAELQAAVDASALGAGQNLGQSYVNINTSTNLSSVQATTQAKTNATYAAQRTAAKNLVSATA